MESSLGTPHSTKESVRQETDSTTPGHMAQLQASIPDFEISKMPSHILLVFTLFSVFWSQIDYRARLLMPWITMAKDPQPAERSVLLDHISPNIAAAWLHSSKARDFPVVLSITGTILMRALVVLSAGLFTLDTTQEQSSSMSVRGGLSFSIDHFNGSQVNGQAISRVYAADSLNLGYPLYTNASIGSEIPPFQNGRIYTSNFLRPSIQFLIFEPRERREHCDC